MRYSWADSLVVSAGRLRIRRGRSSRLFWLAELRNRALHPEFTGRRSDETYPLSPECRLDTKGKGDRLAPGRAMRVAALAASVGLKS